MGAHFIETNLKNTIFSICCFCSWYLFYSSLVSSDVNKMKCLMGTQQKKKRRAGGAQIENNTGNL